MIKRLSLIIALLLPGPWAHSAFPKPSSNTLFSVEALSFAEWFSGNEPLLLDRRKFFQTVVTLGGAVLAIPSTLEAQTSETTTRDTVRQGITQLRDADENLRARGVQTLSFVTLTNAEKTALLELLLIEQASADVQKNTNLSQAVHQILQARFPEPWEDPVFAVMLQTTLHEEAWVQAWRFLNERYFLREGHAAIPLGPVLLEGLLDAVQRTDTASEALPILKDSSNVSAEPLAQALYLAQVREDTLAVGRLTALLNQKAPNRASISFVSPTKPEVLQTLMKTYTHPDDPGHDGAVLELKGYWDSMLPLQAACMAYAVRQGWNPGVDGLAGVLQTQDTDAVNEAISFLSGPGVSITSLNITGTKAWRSFLHGIRGPELVEAAKVTANREGVLEVNRSGGPPSRRPSAASISFDVVSVSPDGVVEINVHFSNALTQIPMAGMQFTIANVSPEAFVQPPTPGEAALRAGKQVAWSARSPVIVIAIGGNTPLVSGTLLTMKISAGSAAKDFSLKVQDVMGVSVDSFGLRLDVLQTNGNFVTSTQGTAQTVLAQVKGRSDRKLLSQIMETFLIKLGHADTALTAELRKLAGQLFRNGAPVDSILATTFDPAVEREATILLGTPKAMLHSSPPKQFEGALHASS